MIKRALFVGLAVGVSVLAYDRFRRGQAERELWREATDSPLDG